MWNYKLALSGAVFIVGLVLAVVAGIESRYWGAAGCFAAGLASAFTILLYDGYVSTQFGIASVFAIALTFFSILETFTSSPLVNRQEGDAQTEFILQLLQLEGGSAHLNSKERKLVTEALKSCVTQGWRDGLDLTISAHKALYFGPALTLVDEANAAFQDGRPLRCLDYYRDLRRTQPSLFTRMERRHPWLLETKPN